MKYPENPILLVDDEPHALTSFQVALRSCGIDNTVTCNDSRQISSLLETDNFDLILLDLVMPYLTGDEILQFIFSNYPDIPVIMVSGTNDVEKVVECMRNGAFDYLLKPVDMQRIEPTIRRALEIRQLRRENMLLQNRFLDTDLKNPEAFSEIITHSQKMTTIFQYCEAISPGPYPVLITGETGTGKELIARAVHRLSGRNGEFVAVNVAGLDDNVFSDTLFGHVKGAFTGADNNRAGLVEKANGGTLFLDEIGDMTEETQIKILRLLEQREYLPLGTDIARPSNARIVVASHRDINELQKKSLFRTDLYFRLKKHHIHLPALRNKQEDIEPLLNFFLSQSCRELGKNNPSYKQEVIDLLKSYSFPGNIRELQSLVIDAVSSHRSGPLNAASFLGNLDKQSLSTVHPSNKPPVSRSPLAGLDRLPTLKESSSNLITEAMRRCDNNQRAAAKMLGITPQALNQRLKRMQ